MVITGMLAVLALWICVTVARDKSAPFEMIAVYWALVTFKYVYDMFKVVG